MAMRSKETPFERRERLNLETAIALSKNSNMTSQIESDSLCGTNPHKQISRSPHFIPNSQSDEEIIQDFTLRDSTAPSKPSPPTTVILPVQSSSMDPGLPAESRAPGWSMDKFHDPSSSTAHRSTHLVKPNQLSHSSSSSSTSHTPQPHILVAPSSASTSNKSSATRPKPRPPRLGAASIEQARERLKLSESTDSSTNPTSSSAIDQSIKDPFHPTRLKSKPPLVLPPSEISSQDVPEQIPAIQQPQTTSDRMILPQSPEITISPNHEPFSRHEQAETQAQSSKKKRKPKTQDNPEPKPPRGSEKAKADGDGKRVRKQSAAGKASAKSLQILLNLSQSSDDTGNPNSEPRDPIIINRDSQKTQRRRVYRNGWVLASDPEPEPELDIRNEVSGKDKDATGGSVHQSPKQNLAPPQVPASKDISSQPFLEIVSSPLSSPTGFSADETASKASKRSKSSVVPKKRVPKKKAAPKPKATKKRKEMIIEPPVNVDNNPSPIALGKRPAVDSVSNKPNSTLNLQDIQNIPMELEAPKEPDKPRSQSPPQLNTRQSPCRRPGTSNNVVLNESPVTREPITVTNQPTSLSDSRKSGPSAADPVRNSTKGKMKTTDGEKKAAAKVRKGMSLAEILAITNPKTKKGIRIGLPREEKHRLHININPNPPVQKQVKKKLKVKRGEYDSGEDDARSKDSGSSDSDDDQDQQNRKKSTRSKNINLDDQEIDEEEEDAKQNDDLDEEY
ncbi:hypothetical protein PGT21_034113 [Puccinia graminis f. sp. tritici]|uniref:Uncharacterized protein n=2 Tax=Puccinia graminis f. sp. tritici TaxID=56615 RepID=A0A5B0M0Y2_PUCGR|nr:hypothetical protein PGT21_034113 [Puccinia graminis f. sp. tritici]